MMSPEQLNILKNNKQYKKTKGIKYNYKYSKGVICSSEFSITIYFTVEGQTWNQLHLVKKIVLWLFKRIFIAKEIGVYRNSVVERVLDSSQDNGLNICTLMTSDMKWISPDAKKLKQLRNIALSFISEVSIELLIFNIKGLTESEKRLDFMNKFKEKIIQVFDRSIENLLKCAVVKSKEDYNRFLITNQYELCNDILQSYTEGNLFNISSKANDNRGE